MNFRSRALRSGLPARVPARLAGSACVRYYHRQDRQIGLGCIYRRAAAMHGILFQRCLVMPATLRTWTAMRQIMLPMRSEEHTSELQSLMRISYAVFCLKKKTSQTNNKTTK